jgi:hypothetical protein
MSTQPAHKLSTTITATGGGSVVVGAPTETLTATLAPFFRGEQGPPAANTFEALNKNLRALPLTITKVGGNISTITYGSGSQQVVKTFGYSDGKLTTISLSGSGLPYGISTTKTLLYSGNDLIGASYS